MTPFATPEEIKKQLQYIIDNPVPEKVGLTYDRGFKYLFTFRIFSFYFVVSKKNN